MRFDEFVGAVRERLGLDSMVEAVRATRVTLTALGERVQPGEARDLAGPLPMEVDRFLLEAESGQRFDFDEFVERVAAGEDVDEETALAHAREIVAFLHEAVPAGEMAQVRGQLPASFEPLFALADERGLSE